MGPSFATNAGSSGRDSTNLVVWVRSPLFFLTITWVCGLYLPISVEDFGGLGRWGLMALVLSVFLARPNVLRIPLLYIGVFLVGNLMGFAAGGASETKKPRVYEETKVFSALVESGPFFDEKEAYLDLRLVGTSTQFNGKMAQAFGELVQLRVHLEGSNMVQPWPCGQPGDVVRILGSFRGRRTPNHDNGRRAHWNAQKRQIGYFAEIKSTDFCLVTLPNAKQGAYVSLQRFRGVLAAKLTQMSSLEAQSFFLALLIGEKRLMKRPLKELLQKAGLSHLIAVSGLHFGITVGGIQAVFLVLFRIIGLFLLGFSAHRWAAIATVPCLLSFVVLTGGNPSCVRAGAMFFVFLMAQILGKNTQLLPTLSLSLLGILAVDLGGLFDVSVGLSFAALFGIFNYLSRSRFCRSGYDRGSIFSYLRDIVGVTVAASLFTMPLVFYYFHWFSVGGFVLNLFATPVVSFVIFPFVLLSVVMGLFGLTTSSYPFAVAEFGFEILLSFARWFHDLKLLGFYVTPPTVSQMLLAWLVLVFMYQLRKPVSWFVHNNHIVVALVGTYLLTGLFPNEAARELRVHFIPVGQGDCVFIEFPNGQSMLIDTGPRFAEYSAAKSIVGPFIRRRGYTRINAVVITHADNDHVGGLDDILDEFEVDKVFWNRQSSSVKFRNVLPQSRISPLMKKDDLAFGAVRLRALHPDCIQNCQLTLSENDRSTVMRLDYGETSILFTGDIEADIERRLIQDAPDLLNVDILKVAHHGSRTSSTRRFLETVSPDLSVIMVGRKNRFGHPHKGVAQRLLKHSTKGVLRTDKNGIIQVSSDGGSYRVVTGAP